MNIDPHSSTPPASHPAPPTADQPPTPMDSFAETSPAARALARSLTQAINRDDACIDVRNHAPEVLADLPDATLSLIGRQMQHLRLPAGCPATQINRWLQHAPRLRTLELPQVQIRRHGEPAIDLTPAARLTAVVTPVPRADTFINPRRVPLGPDLLTRQHAVLRHAPPHAARALVHANVTPEASAEPPRGSRASRRQRPSTMIDVSQDLANDAAVMPGPGPTHDRGAAVQRPCGPVLPDVVPAQLRWKERPARERPDREPSGHLKLQQRRQLRDIPAVRAQLLAWMTPRPDPTRPLRFDPSLLDDSQPTAADVRRVIDSVPERLLPFHARDSITAARCFMWGVGLVLRDHYLHEALTALQHVEDLATVRTVDGPRLRTEAEMNAVSALRDWVTEVQEPPRMLMRDDVADQLIRLWGDQRPSAERALRFLAGAGPVELPRPALLLALGPRTAPIRLILELTSARDNAAFRASLSALPIDTVEIRHLPDLPLRSNRATARQDNLPGLDAGGEARAAPSHAAAGSPSAWLMPSLDLTQADGPLPPGAIDALGAQFPRLRQVLLPGDWPHHAADRTRRPLGAPLRRSLEAEGRAESPATDRSEALRPSGAPALRATTPLMDTVSDARLRQAPTLDLSAFDVAEVSALPAQTLQDVGASLRHLSLPPGLSASALNDWLRRCPNLKRLDAPDIQSDPREPLDLGLGPADLTLHTSPGWLPSMMRRGRPEPRVLPTDDVAPIHLPLDHDGPLPARLQGLQTHGPLRPFARPSTEALADLRELLTGARLTPASSAPLALGDHSEAARMRQWLHGVPHTLIPMSMRPVFAELVGLPYERVLGHVHADGHGFQTPVTPWLGTSVSGTIDVLLREIDRALHRSTPEGRRMKTDEELALRASLLRWAEPGDDGREQRALREAVAERLMRPWDGLVQGPILLTDELSGPAKLGGSAQALMELPPRHLMRSLGLSADPSEGSPIDLQLHLRQPGPLDHAEFLNRSAQLPFRLVRLYSLPEGAAPVSWLPRSTQTLDLLHVAQPLDLSSWMDALASFPRLTRIELRPDQWTALAAEQAALDDPSRADPLALRIATGVIRRYQPSVMERVAAGERTLNPADYPAEMREAIDRSWTSLFGADAPRPRLPDRASAPV